MSVEFVAKGLGGGVAPAAWLSLFVVLGLVAAACGDDDTTAGAASETRTLPARSRRALTPSPAARCGSATSPTSPTPRRSSGSRRASSPRRSATTSTLETEHLQRRPRGHRGAVRRARIDATFIGPEPGHQRASPSPTARPSRIVAGSDVGRRLPRRAPTASTSPEDLAGKTPRHAAARQHAGRRPAGLAGRPGLRDRHSRRRRRVDPAAGERRHPHRLPGRRHRRRLGARALGHPPHPGGRRPGARRRARPVARRRSSSPPT